MLSQMADKPDVRHHGSSIDLQQLDITSYLSAPNRINTCNSHLGSVYRIFTDLSGMGWKEKHTPLYNIATHSMDKIKQTFDPETGQVHKDDEGRLKIRQVVDWPLSSGFKGGAELNDFFKWAEHLNNYHPEVIDTVHSKVPKGYHPIRYQTKAYDACTNCLSVFTKDEWELLESYRWLREVPEFFKPQDLFSAMSNAEDIKEAEQKLHNFELGDDSICCPDANTLRVLMPYVKRLIRLFPDIKEKVKEQMLSPQIRNKVYQHETQRYVEKILHSALDFKPSALGLREFLDSDQHIWQLRMTDGDAWTGITKVFQVLKNTSCTPKYFSEGNYTILKLKRLLTVNRMINLNSLLASMETPHLLMIACRTNQQVDDELENMFKELFNTLKQKNTMKIILTTQSGDRTFDFLQQKACKIPGKGIKTTDEEITWNELTTNSQRKVLEKTVIFQGRRVALNQLISAESMTDSFPLSNFLQETEFRIGKEPVPSAGSGYNEKYYIDRTFSQNIIFRSEISSDKREGKFADLVASNEQEFKQLCQQNPKENVHWLEEEKSGELIWQQSQGSLQALRKYTDARKSHSYAPSNLDKLLERAKHQRVMLIADKAGMGKTTVLTHLSKRIQQKFPAHWLVRTDLNDYTELLKAQKGKKKDKGWVLEFLSKEVLKLESYLEKELFKKSFEGNEISKVVVMVDGFDEICPIYKETVFEMLQVLKQTSFEQLWVTTRPHLREELEDNLQQLSYTLQPFSEVEQVEFLKKLWHQHLDSEAMGHNRLEIYATALIRKLAQSISDKNGEFTGIPLQTLMLAEAFKEEFVSFYLSEKSESELPQKLDLNGLYIRFIDRKYDIYYEEKCKTPAGNVAVEGLRQYIFEQLQEQHERLALETLFNEDEVTFLQIYSQSKFSDEELVRIGLVQKNNEGKPQFIHRTFAEYFVADFLIKQLTKKTKPHPQVQEFLVSKVLLRTDCHVIRAFLDGLLDESRPKKEAIKQCGELLNEQWNEREMNGILVGFKTPLHEAAAEGNDHIIGLLLDSLKSEAHSNPPTKMLFATDREERTAWHVAAENDSVQALKKIWEWAEEVTAWQVTEEIVPIEMNVNELKNKLLLDTDKYGNMAWHWAAKGGSLQALQALWSWAKEVGLKPRELLLERNKERKTTWQVAVEEENVKVLQKIWDWCKEAQLNSNELKNKLLLAKDKDGYTSWHIAAQRSSIDILETIWNWAKEAKLKPCELLLARSGKGYTAWQMAAEEMQLEVLKKMWVWAKEAKLNPSELKDKLLLAKDKYGYTAWHRAAEKGSLEALKTLWSWAKEVEVKPLDLLLAKGGRGRTALHIAADENHTETLTKLWACAEEAQQNQNKFKKELFLAKDNYGCTAWHRAAKCGHLQALEILWSWADKEEVNRAQLLRAENKVGNTAWKMAAQQVHLEVLKKLWEWEGEVQPYQKQSINQLLLAKDWYGNTVWHQAAAKGSLEALETLWSWAKEVGLNTDELLLAQNEKKETTWQIAMARSHFELLQKLWVWAKEMELKSDMLKNKMLLVKDKDENTMWHRALEISSNEDISALVPLHSSEIPKLLQKLWGWAKEVELQPHELKSNLLLAKNKYGETVFHLAAGSGRVEALQMLWSWAKEVQLLSNELKNKLLLTKNNYGNTAFHLAAGNGRLEALQILWSWAKEVQPLSNELQNKLLLAKNKNRNTAFHLAAESGRLQALHMLWSWAKDVQLKPVQLLLLQNKHGYTAWQLAVKSVHLEVLKKVWEWAKDAQLNPNHLLLAKDECGYTAWHRAAAEGNLEALDTLRSWAEKEKLNPDDLRSRWLLAQNERGETAWNMAAVGNQEAVLKKLWVRAKEMKLDRNELRNKLFLATDKYGCAMWHQAAERGSLQALETLWSWAKEAGLNRVTMKNKLLLAKNEDGETAWDIAARNRNEDVLEKLWGLAKEVKLNRNVLKNNLLLAKDWYGKTAWDRAAEAGSLKISDTLWSMEEKWFKKMKRKRKFLPSHDEESETAKDMAAIGNPGEVLKKLWVWAKEVELNRSELRNKLLLAKDRMRETVWHQAAERGSLEGLDTIWSWVKEVKLNPDKLLLAQNVHGETARQLAEKRGHLDVLEKLEEWDTEVQLHREETEEYSCCQCP
jgi:ankyrin repeat protein